ncbi:MAG: hypothetical protein ACTSV1_02225 [Alphaproteobacteria bacterium]
MTEENPKPVAIPLAHAIFLTIFCVAFSSIFVLPLITGEGGMLDAALAFCLIIFLPGAVWFSRRHVSKKSGEDEK